MNEPLTKIAFNNVSEPETLEESPESLAEQKRWTIVFNVALFLQFHLPIAFYFYAGVWTFFRSNAPTTHSEDAFVANIVAMFLLWSIPLLLIEYAVVRYFIRKDSVRTALFFLIYANIFHSLCWLVFGVPLVLMRLSIPTILYVILSFCGNLPRYSPGIYVSLKAAFVRWIAAAKKSGKFWRRPIGRIRLNLRALRLVLQGKWLLSEDVREDYDALAADYDDAWLVRLKATTDRLLERLPESLDKTRSANETATEATNETTNETAKDSDDSSRSRSNVERILDLGCGTGYSTNVLARKYPDADLVGIDLSPGMLERAKERNQENVRIRWDERDLLTAMKSEGDASASLVFSAWAIGYSVPSDVVREASRVLKPGGVLAVVVNKKQTTPAVFDAFRQTMYRFPNLLQKATLPQFPKNGRTIRNVLRRNGFQTTFFEENAVALSVPPPGERFDWLSKTGVLAGFDRMLPLKTNVEVRQWFARLLDSVEIGWEHRYLLFVAVKK